MNSARSQLMRFALIGAVGFAIDGSLLTLLSVVWGLNVYVARLVSFLTATLSTWWLNRKHTFGMAPAREFRVHANEYTRYFFIQIGGGLINLAVFAWLVYLEPAFRALPILPLACGAGVALLWNFAGARLFVYRR